MSRDMHQLLYEAVRKFIPPPNPIIEKDVGAEEEGKGNVVVAVEAVDVDSDEEEEGKNEEYGLAGVYSKKMLVFQKWPQRVTNRNKINYFASTFLQRGNLLPTLKYGGITQQSEIQFDSSIQSGNLLAVFKVAEDKYDLILQNDLNSGGYTQWFNFIVTCKKRTSITFNIVNLYKKHSLFTQGLRPLSRSLVFDKNWKRACHSVQYYPSEIRMQARKAKYYKVLSFRYDFVFQNDRVQFCSSYPYSTQTLQNFMNGINSQKLRVKFLGATPLKKVMMMLKINAIQNEERSKKAIVILARQHSGETPSSYIVQYLIESLLGASMESEFLLSRYNFYIFPMVNMDGVYLGNYRCNFYGFDLNRCWNLQQSRKHPQITMIKQEIKKIMKKQSIELLLDLHAHSTKYYRLYVRMNSFFYGNSYGRYNMLFPYVASKMDEFIGFSDCTFAEQDEEKANTARVILGRMIKDTGSAYTYQVSLFGGIKNGKKIAFTPQIYRSLAGSLIMAIHKCGLELHKQQSSQKQTIFLKEIRRQLRKYRQKLKVTLIEGSDDEAIKTSLIEQKAKKLPQKSQISLRKQIQKQRSFRIQDILVQRSTQTEDSFSLQQYKLCCLPKIQDKKKSLDEASSKNRSFSLKRNSLVTIDTSIKMDLMNKLRVFGETVSQDSVFPDISKLILKIAQQCQTNLSLRSLQDKSKKNYRNLMQYFQGSSNFMAYNGFAARNLGEPRVNRRDRFRKTSSTRSTKAQMNFTDLLMMNKFSQS